MRVLLAVVVVFLFAAVAIAASASLNIGAPASSPTARPFYTAIPAVATIPPDVGMRAARTETRLFGRFIVPIEGAEVPSDLELLPEARRDYRAGIHEGIDFAADEGTPVRAAAAGIVARVDATFTDWTPEELEAALSEAVGLGHTPPRTLDRVRGRQVWIDHGRGIVTRYAHLATVASLAIGQRIEEGLTIGTVGSSGYPQGGPHLHFEVRIGDTHYGDGLTGATLARAVSRLFR